LGVREADAVQAANIFSVWDQGSRKLRKPSLRVTGKRILDEESYCWSDFCVVVSLLEKV
jgi:hypothetical protein